MAAIRCNPTILINNQLFNPSYEDGLRTEMIDVIFPASKPLIDNAISREKRGVDRLCDWTQVTYYHALIDMLIGFKREFNELVIANNGCISNEEIKNLKESWSFNCIRGKMTCMFGAGSLFDELSRIAAVSIDGLDFMVLEDDGIDCTNDFIIP